MYAIKRTVGSEVSYLKPLDYVLGYTNNLAEAHKFRWDFEAAGVARCLAMPGEILEVVAAD